MTAPRIADLGRYVSSNGYVDLPCPNCGPERRSTANQRRKVLRVWRGVDHFITWFCARCGDSGFRFGERREPRDPAAIALDPRELVKRRAEEREVQLRKAVWLWRSRQPIRGSIAETYLREARGYTGPLPTTLGFLPARDEYPPAMIACFGIPTEPEPGVLHISDSAVRGVHLTRLKPDGSDKDDGDPDKQKIMIGHSIGSPIVLAPLNDLLGLAIAEGIEDALSTHQATGLGAWAAGAATRMPALADIVPDYADCVTLIVDDNDPGRLNSKRLAALLVARGIHVELST